MGVPDARERLAVDGQLNLHRLDTAAKPNDDGSRSPGRGLSRRAETFNDG